MLIKLNSHKVNGLTECKNKNYEIHLPAGTGDLGQCDEIAASFFNVFTIGGLQSFSATDGVRLGNLISKCDPLSVII